ncbi:MAG TPA: PDZ domain-containing protein [Pirellulales bacterium]
MAFSLLLLTASPALAQRGLLRTTASNLRDGQQVRTAFKTVVAQANQSTVRVLCEGKDAALGAVVGADGWIVTKYSELHEPIECRFDDGKSLAAQLVGHDVNYDLAMLKVNAKGLKVVDWSDDDKGPEVGQLLATTAPGDLPRAIGVVSVPRRTIGAKQGILGIHFTGDDERPKVDIVTPGSGADKGGLKVGDIIIKVDDKLVETTNKMIDTIHQYKPGDTVSLTVHRGEDDLSISATLTRPGEVGPITRSDRMNAMGGALSRRSTDFPSVIEHDTVLKPADCGGPIVDLSGKVVGINIARAGRVESYAVPADKVRSLLADLENGNLAPKTLLPGSKQAKLDDKKTDDKKVDGQKSDDQKSGAKTSSS